MKNRLQQKLRLVLAVCLSWLSVTTAMSQVQIGLNGALSSYFYGPIYRSSNTSTFHYSMYSYIYTATELAAAGMNPGDVISSIQFYKNSTFTLSGANTGTLEIWIQNSSLTNQVSGTTWGTIIAPATLVHSVTYTSSTFPVTTGWIDFPFSSSFTYTGQSLIVSVRWTLNPSASPFTGGAFNWLYASGYSMSAATIGAAAGSPQSNSTILSTSSYGGALRPNTRMTFTAGSPCSGQPTPGNTLASANPVCASTSFSLTLQNSTPGSGVTYQWQSSPDGSTWTNVGPNSSSYTTSITSPTYYQCIVTCTNSGLSGTSNPVLVNLIPFYDCYCASSATNTADEEIFSVTVGSMTNSSTCTTTACGPGSVNSRYSNYKGCVTGPTVTQGEVVPFSLTLGYCGTFAYSNMAAIYIDFNQNGLFTDPGENVYTKPYGPGTLPSFVVSGTFTVPLTAAVGTTGMRIVYVESNSISPCGTYSWGETEDYLINIQQLVSCSGQPTGGTASASANPVCQNNQTTLSLSGHTTGAGITYQWQKSATPGGPYTDISGASTATYVYTPSSAGTEYIVCKVTCNNSGLDDLSSEITLTVDPSPSSTISGPSTGLTYQNLSYTATGYPLGSNFQWQVSTTSCATGFSNIGPDADNLVAVANASGTYYIRCVVTNAGCSAPSNCIAVTVSVAGDNVCDAITVTTGNNGPFSNQTATAQPGEVVPPGTGCTTQTGWCNNTGTINSVWFKFTPAVSGRYSIHLVNDPPTMNYFDSQLAIYSVGNCNNFGTFTLIAANDDSLGLPYHSYIAPVCLTAGTTYYILADGYGSTVSNAFGIRIVQVSTLTASISGTDNICLGNSGVVTLNFTGTPPFSYTIAGNGGPYTGSTSNTTQSVAVLPVSGGTQTYTVTSFGDGQCPNGGAGTGSATVNVSTAPPAGTIHTVNAPVSACAGSVQLITANHGVTGSFINFSWNTGTNSSAVLFSNNIGGPFVPGPFVTNGPNVYAQFGALGLNQSGYNICLQAVNGCGSSNNKCNFTRGTVTVPAGITGSSVQCSGATGQTYSVTGPAPAGVETFIWSFSVPGATITSLDPPLNSQVSIDFPAFTTGTLSVQAALSCLGSSVSPARTLAISTATAAPGVPSGPSKVCPGNSYNYSVAPVAGASTYNWTVPANASITAGAGTNSITVQFNATPINFVNGIISVNTTSVCGATSGTTSRTVSSMVPSTPGNISGQATGVCSGTFNYQVPAVPGVIYNWTLPAGATGSSTTNIIPVTFSNSYVSGTISVTGSAAGCAVQSAPRNLNVSGVPATPAAITSPFPPCNGGPGQFSTGTVFGATGYTWTVPANGTTLDLGQGTTTIDVTWGTGNGTVTVKADNACGSSGLRTLYYVPGCRLAAEEASEVSSLTVYPNPAHTQATIAFKAPVQGSYAITLTDVSGRVVRSMVTSAQAGAHQVIIDLSDIAKGMYMVELRSDTGTEMQKLVVE